MSKYPLTDLVKQIHEIEKEKEMIKHEECGNWHGNSAKACPAKVCSICGEDIDVDPISGWDGGHNAAPVNDGRCCTRCNTTVVIPRRIRDIARAAS